MNNFYEFSACAKAKFRQIMRMEAEHRIVESCLLNC